MRRVLHEGQTPPRGTRTGAAVPGAVHAPRTGEPVGKDTAAQVGPEVALYPGGDAEAQAVLIWMPAAVPEEAHAGVEEPAP